MYYPEGHRWIPRWGTSPPEWAIADNGKRVRGILCCTTRPNEVGGGATEVFLECSNEYGLTAHLRGPRGTPALLPPCWPPTPDQPVQGFLFLLLSPSEEVAHCTTSWWWDRETEVNHHKAVARGQPHPASGPFLPRHAALNARPLASHRHPYPLCKHYGVPLVTTINSGSPAWWADGVGDPSLSLCFQKLE